MTSIELKNISKKYYITSHKSQSFKELFIKNLLKKKKIEELWALKDISFEIEKGCTLGIIGSNGSGKSTLLRIIAGITTPTVGDVIANGRISSLLELGAGFHHDLTGYENVFLNGTILGLKQKEIRAKLKEIIDFSELEQFMNTPVKHYSSGMYVRLGFSVAVNIDPDILLVDEVLSVGDAFFQIKSFSKIKSFKKQGKTIIFVTHLLDAVDDLCDEVIWLEDGEIKKKGATYDVLKAYKDSINVRAAKLQPEKYVEGTIAARMDGRFISRTGIEITKVRLLNQKNEETDVFFTNEPMTVEIYYNATEKVENVDFHIGFRRSFDGIPVCINATNLNDIETGILEGKGVVKAYIERLSLYEGKYTMGAGIFPHNSIDEPYDMHLNLYPITMKTKRQVRPGLVTEIICRWKINKQEQDVTTNFTNFH